MGKEERTKEMINNFFSHKKDGKTNKEIADMYGLSMWTIHHYLQEIADKNGVAREDLLDRIQKPHEITMKAERKNVERIDASILVRHYSNMLHEVDEIVSILDNFLKENEAVKPMEEE